MTTIGMSKVGLVRKRNEDRHYAGPDYCIVADGMGGYSGGEFASTLAIDEIRRVIDRASSPSEAVLEEAILTANQYLYEKSHANEELKGMGTTAVIAYLADNKHLLWASVGDSRLYVFQDGQLHQVSHDHSMVQELVDKGTLAESEVLHHPQRNMLTRAVGVSTHLEVDTGTLDVIEGDRFLLCSDGLSGLIEDSEIARILRETADDEQAIHALMTLVYEAGAKDNVTIILGRI